MLKATETTKLKSKDEGNMSSINGPIRTKNVQFSMSCNEEIFAMLILKVQYNMVALKKGDDYVIFNTF